MNKIFKNKSQNGYAILELLFYISFFAVLSIVVIDAMITMARSFKETSIQAELIQSGSVMERISREVRQANDITSISTNDLVLNTGSNKTLEFKLVGGDIELLDSGNNVGNLNPPNIVITNLNFSQMITTTTGKAVKIVFSIKSNNDTLARVQDFYDTVVLRGSY